MHQPDMEMDISPTTNGKQHVADEERQHSSSSPPRESEASNSSNSTDPHTSKVRTPCYAFLITAIPRVTAQNPNQENCTASEPRMVTYSVLGGGQTLIWKQKTDDSLMQSKANVNVVGIVINPSVHKVIPALAILKNDGGVQQATKMAAESSEKECTNKKIIKVKITPVPVKMYGARICVNPPAKKMKLMSELNNNKKARIVARQLNVTGPTNTPVLLHLPQKINPAATVATNINYQQIKPQVLQMPPKKDVSATVTSANYKPFNPLPSHNIHSSVPKQQPLTPQTLESIDMSLWTGCRIFYNPDTFKFFGYQDLPKEDGVLLNEGDTPTITNAKPKRNRSRKTKLS